MTTVHRRRDDVWDYGMWTVVPLAGDMCHCDCFLWSASDTAVQIYRNVIDGVPVQYFWRPRNGIKALLLRKSLRSTRGVCSCFILMKHKARSSLMHEYDTCDSSPLYMKLINIYYLCTYVTGFHSTTSHFWRKSVTMLKRTVNK